MIVMDAIKYPKKSSGTELLPDDYDEVYKKESKNEEDKPYCELFNKITAVYDRLYKSGELFKICNIVDVNYNKKADLIVDFAFDFDKLPENIKSELTEIFKGGPIKDINMLTPCLESGTVGLAHLCKKTYRSNCGCVGSTWEHPFIEELGSGTLGRINEVRVIEGELAAAIFTLNALWGNIGGYVGKQ